MHTRDHHGHFLVTNNHWRPVIHGFELGASDRARFDYVDWQDVDNGSADASFFRYRGELYDLAELEVAPHELKAHGFDGMQAQSAFDAIAVMWFDGEGRYRGDEEVVIAHVHW